MSESILPILQSSEASLFLPAEQNYEIMQIKLTENRPSSLKISYESLRDMPLRGQYRLLPKFVKLTVSGRHRGEISRVIANLYSAPPRQISLLSVHRVAHAGQETANFTDSRKKKYGIR